MWEEILKLLVMNLETILVGIAGIVASFIYKNKADEADAIKSIRTGVADFFQNDPEMKAILADGKITPEEWALIFQRVGPIAASVATKGGAKVLKQWTGPVANKYIEAVARELAVEFADVPKIVKPDVAAAQPKVEIK